MSEEKKNYYAIIPANVRYDKSITPNAKLLYGEITALCNEKRYCWASNNYFADLYEVTPQAISKWINQLAKKGYITLDYERAGKEIKQRNIYIATYQQIIKEVSTKDDGGINKRLRGYQQKIKENTTVNNTSNNIKEKTQNKTQDQFLMFYQNYPKKTNKTDARKTFNKLIKSGETLDSILSKLTIYKKQIEKDQTDIKYIKNPQRFLNCIEDYEAEEEKKPVSEKKICPSCGKELTGLFCKTCFTQYNEKMEATF